MSAAPAALPLSRGVLPRLAVSTPRTIGLLMAGLVALCLLWGAIGAWTADVHAAAATQVVRTREPLSLTARQMYQALSDADVTATTAFLTGPDESLAARQRYQHDISLAATRLSELQGAEATWAAGPAAASLATVAASLPVYHAYVAQAQSDYAFGFESTGSGFLTEASEVMHLTLLPAARRIYADTNARLTASSAAAAGLPTVVITLALSVVLGWVLYRAQRWLSRRTRRIVNYGLLGASVALGIVAVWLVVSFAVGRADLNRAEAHGSVPVEALAQAAITVQRARGDQMLNLISRSGTSSFLGDFNTARRQTGPGAGSLLARAAAGSTSSGAVRALAAADSEAHGWYQLGEHVFTLDSQNRYTQETNLVIGSGPGSSAAGFSRLQRDLSAAITADQANFAASANRGAGALTGLSAAFAIAALFMAAGCAWGLSRRLAEYR
ncbi:MAG TPA: hypothetical protein VGI58_03440 [Streptosporangiaceae bacterium]